MIFDLTTPQGKKLTDGWHLFVEEQHRSDVYWDPKDERWETYPPYQFLMTRSAIPRHDVGPFILEWNLLNEVLRVSYAIRVSGGSVIWNPRDGFWYFYKQISAPPPAPPPPPPPPPDWIKNMDRDLAAIDAAKNLSPADRAAARLKTIDIYVKPLLR